MARLVRAVVSLVLPLALPLAARAADEDSGPVAAGHSTHGRAYDEGPRQQAYLMRGMPKVDFPISCRGSGAQAFFNQGIGQLHGFWYFEAERSFRQVALIDPLCAMPFVGMTLANAYNETRAASFISRAVALRESADAREKMWIDALAAYHRQEPKPDLPKRRKDWVKGLEAIIDAYPDDLEAKAFLVLALWDNSANFTWFDRGVAGEPIASVRAVVALANEVLAKNPMHPLHHYIIHLWDGEHGRRAVPSAARSGQSGPGIAHMWHMAAHTFTKVKRYQDAVWQQEAAARVDHAYMARDLIFPDQIHNYGHNNDWLVKNYALVGRVHDAVALAKNLVEIPRHPVWNGVDRTAVKGLAFATAQLKRENSATFGRQRLFEIGVRYELWDELIALARTPQLAPTDDAVDGARRARALALAHYARGDLREGDRARADLDTALRRLKDERVAAVEEAEKKARADKQPDAELAKAVTGALEKQSAAVKQAETAVAEIAVVRTLAARGRPTAKSLEALSTLSKDRQAVLFFQAGERDKALTLAREAAEKAEGEVPQLALLADLSWRAGKTQQAQEALRKLRAIAPSADLDVPLLRRMAPIAASLKLPRDWRLPHREAADVAGTRPPLQTLGPRIWTPPRAAELALRDARGKTVSLAQYRGRPVIAIFYLGYGCLHCLEQLALFAPAAAKFKAAGISLVAVSADSVEGLAKTVALSKERGATLPFPLLSDEKLQAFKRYRAFDGFENVPLHGTFLIDGQGLIRWHDISYEPFREVDFLLTESKRLLQIKAPRPRPALRAGDAAVAQR